jgi:FMN phosphatase YigB (HAD superfamily)
MRTIVWDLDDVLNDLMLAWFNEAWIPAHPECRLSYSEITENPPDRVLGISRAEYLASLDEFRLSERARSLRPNAAVLAWLERSGADYRHVALTARPIGCTAPAAEWLFRHFGSYIRTFGVVPSRLATGEPAYDTTKGDFLRWFGRADILVDDSEENIRSAEKFGIRGVLYPQPWNRCSLSVEGVLESLNKLFLAH